MNNSKNSNQGLLSLLPVLDKYTRPTIREMAAVRDNVPIPLTNKKISLSEIDAGWEEAIKNG